MKDLRKKLHRSSILFGLTFIIYPLFFLVLFLAFPLNEKELIIQADKAVVDINPSVRLVDKKLLSNKEFLLYVNDKNDEFIVVFAERAPILERFRGVYVTEITDQERTGDQNETVLVNGNKLEVIEQRIFNSGTTAVLVTGLLWLVSIYVRVKKVRESKRANCLPAK